MSDILHEGFVWVICDNHLSSSSTFPYPPREKETYLGSPVFSTNDTRQSTSCSQLQNLFISIKRPFLLRVQKRCQSKCRVPSGGVVSVPLLRHRKSSSNFAPDAYVEMHICVCGLGRLKNEMDAQVVSPEGMRPYKSKRDFFPVIFASF